MAGSDGRWARWLADQRAQRESAGLQRRLLPREADDELVDLAGNDYLGLSTHPEVVAGATSAASIWGAGAGASRLVTGTTRLHLELETELAAYAGQPAGLVLSTGYHASLSIVTALADKHTFIASDAHVHASLIDAVRLSRGQFRVTPHNDVRAVEAALGARREPRALVLVESIYSVLGDAAPLLELADVCARNDALLIVDEAHGLGVRGGAEGPGRGLVHELGLADQPHVLVACTLSKALGAQGGAVLGPVAIVDQLVNRARPFIFDTGLAPPSAGAALAALRLLAREPERVERGRERALEVAEAVGVAPPAGWVMSVPMASPQVALAAQQAAREQGVAVGCFRPPSVPDGVSRLRLTINAGVSDVDWKRAVDVVTDVVAGHR